MKNILLVGETWTSTATHVKGWDQFPSITHHNGATDFMARVGSDDWVFQQMTCEQAVNEFPDTTEALAKHDVIILSDIGANSFLLPPATWLHSQRSPNRLKALRAYVEQGGALIMVGGYLSFQGINGAARYHRTPVEQVLPVSMRAVDDRLELPEGIVPETVPGAEAHPALAGLTGTIPFVLGMNEVTAKPEANVLLRLPENEGGHPFLAVGHYGLGRTAAWMTDIGPHWMPTEFLEWDGLAPLWHGLLAWLVSRDGS